MLPPLVERELRVALLRRKAHTQWLTAAWLAGAATLLFLLLLGLTSNRSSGRTLFQWLLALAVIRIVVQGFNLTADLLSEERRNGTLGLLVLTGLEPLAIFTNKLLGAVLLVAYGLLGGMPFFAIPFLTGGVPASHFICSVAFLANGLLFCIATGLLASVLHRDGGQAQFAAQALAAVLCGLTPLIYWFGSTGGAFALRPAWLALSPAYPGYLLFTGFLPGSARLFWIGSAITLGYSLLGLVLAALILQFTWREEAGAPPKGWASQWRSWSRGGQKWQGLLRRRFLADQPFCWLATRDSPPVLIAFGVLVVAAAVWFAGRWAVGPSWVTPINSFITSLLLHHALNFVGAYAAGRRFAEERVSGGFEILLTAPIRVTDMVEGQSKALLVQFRGVALLVLAVDFALCLAGLLTLHQTALGTTAYLLAWVLMLVFWFGVHLETAAKATWISAWTGRPAFAAMKACRANGWALLYLWFLSRQSLGNLMSQPWFVLATVGFMAFPCLLTFERRRLLREKLTRELRQIAIAPIPARNDKRFKSWDPLKIFPPPATGMWTRGPLKLNKRMDALNG